MSVIQQHTAASLSDQWRLVNVDALDPDSSLNFDTTTLHPPLAEISEAEVRQLNGQVRQLLRAGDSEGALRGCLESPVYNGSDTAKEAHMQTVVEVLQSIKASEMTPMLQRVHGSEGGGELLDVLMKYLCVISPSHITLAPSLLSFSSSIQALRWLLLPDEAVLMKNEERYKGMSGTSGPRTPTRAGSGLAPQPSGFSQIGTRPSIANESTGAAMSVLLSWHEKVVDVAGLGAIIRVMTDGRKV